MFTSVQNGKKNYRGNKKCSFRKKVPFGNPKADRHFAVGTVTHSGHLILLLGGPVCTYEFF